MCYRRFDSLNNSKIHTLLISVFFMLIFAASASARQVTLAWDTNSEPAGVPPLIKANDSEGFENVRDLIADGTVTWNIDNNYAVGWSGSPPNRWFNYTREIPAGSYEIWAGMAVNNTGASSMRSALDMVVSGADSTNQVTTPLGVLLHPSLYA